MSHLHKDQPFRLQPNQQELIDAVRRAKKPKMTAKQFELAYKFNSGQISLEQLKKSVCEHVVAVIMAKALNGAMPYVHIAPNKSTRRSIRSDRGVGGFEAYEIQSISRIANQVRAEWKSKYSNISGANEISGFVSESDATEIAKILCVGACNALRHSTQLEF